MPILEEFDRRVVLPRCTRPTWPIISVRMRGTFGLNRAAYEALGKPRAVTLVHGVEERVVGFRPSDDDCPKAYVVRETKPNGGSYEVTGTKFFKFYGITNDQCRRYAAQMEDGNLLIYLDRDEKKPPEGV